ncbi:hypothetical protein [Actinomadura kijaniata]|uniref:hypothetical protein n=1 Tax=Actinomadura kijaniata TaxID=46161 RepID=UPI000A55CB42|nr:hypothetical protein [Actinomadura kijaniata]
MPSVLVSTPLRTARAFISPDHAAADPATLPTADGDQRPLGYAYSTPLSKRPGPDPQAGAYDQESQTWLGPDGKPIEAGYSSWTRTGIYNDDRYLDDICA